MADLSGQPGSSGDNLPPSLPPPALPKANAANDKKKKVGLNLVPDMAPDVIPGGRQQEDDGQGANALLSEKSLDDDDEESEPDPDDGMGSAIDSMLYSYGLTHEQINQQLGEESAVQWHAESLVFEHAQFGPLRKRCYCIIHDLRYQTLIAIVISVNIISIGYEADQAAARVAEGINADEGGVPVAEHIFTAIFVCELFISMMGCPTSILLDGWLCADIFIVGVAVLDNWVIAPLTSQNSLSFLTAFRVLRVLRVLRVFRLVRFMRPLRILAEALGEAFVSILWMLIFVPLVAYAFAVVFTSVIGTLPELPEWENLQDYAPGVEGDLVLPTEYFRDVITSMLTLACILLQGIRWGPRILRPLLLVDDWRYVSAGLVLVVFIVFGLVCLVNLISGLFVSALFNAAKRDTEVIDRQSLSEGDTSMKRLRDFFREMDTNKDNQLSWEEFKAGLESNPFLCKALKIEIGQAEALYNQLDIYGDSGGVNIEEYFIGLIKMTRLSKSIDMLSIDYQQQKTFRDLAMLSQICKSDIDQIGTFISDVQTCLRSLTTEVTRLAEDLTSVEKDLDTEVDPLADPDVVRASLHHLDLGQSNNQGPEVQALLDLERRFQFKSRMERISDNLNGMADTVCENPAAQGNDADGEALAEAFWSNIVDSEVMPWLRRTLQEVVEERRHEGVEAAVEAGSDPGVTIQDDHEISQV